MTLRQRPVAGGRLKEYRVGVTQEERETLEKLALAEGVTVPRYLVAVGMNRVPMISRLQLQQLVGVKQLMARDRANLNQLAHWANTGGYELELHESALQSYLVANGRLVEYLDEVAK